MKKQIEFKLGGKTKVVEYDDGESILDTAIRNGLNAPYSCMEGICTACMAIVTKGEVDFPDDTILDEQEAKNGKTLTCQAKPKANCAFVSVDYDAC